ncbi:HtaA domain-containing protein [Mycetocola saprophilus]|uniref:HtaA domain-containing protein n=1 Tax=Mycetocola saprophilus TaxID=76636 RepID=UPI003BEF7909
MKTLHRALGVAPLIGALALAPLLGAGPAHAAPDNTRSYSYVSSVAAGNQARQFALDERNGALYVPTDNGDGQPGALTRVGSAAFTAETPIPLESAATRVAVDPATNTAFVARDDLNGGWDFALTGSLDVIDLATGAVTKTIHGVPTTTDSIVYYPRTNTVYAMSNDYVVPIDPAAGTVGTPVEISTVADTYFTNAVIDPANDRLWAGNRTKGTIEAFDLRTNTWLKDQSIPVTTFTFDGTVVGGSLAALAIDPALNQIYAVLNPNSKGVWNAGLGKLVVANTQTRQILGTPIQVGKTSRAAAVDTRSHEVYVTSSEDSALTVISPDTWTAKTAVDFVQAGIVSGYGTGPANLWGVATDPTNNAVFVSHPYSKTPLSSTQSAISKVAVSGALPAVTTLAPAPGQGDTQPSTPPVVNPVFSGPKAPALAKGPDGAVEITANSLTWDISAYASAWEAHPYGGVRVSDKNAFTFSSGTGWSDPKTGAAQIGWGDAIEYRPYPGLAPDVFLTFANPYLVRNADGSGALSFDVAWGESKSNVSAGYKRVTLATFTNLSLSVQADGSTAISGTPVYAGRVYQAPGQAASPNSFPKSFIDYLDPALRGWWMTTSASADGNARKVPNPIAGTFTATAKPSEANGPSVDGGEAVVTPTPEPSTGPSTDPSTGPSTEPSTGPSTAPSTDPSTGPTTGPSTAPSTDPSAAPSIDPGTPDNRTVVPVTIGSSAAVAGGSVHLRASGFAAGETVEIWLHSTPVRLATVTADARGLVEATVTIPATTPPGAHTLKLEGTTARGEVPVTVSAALSTGDVAPVSAGPGQLSQTGANIAGVLIAGSVLLLLGLGFVLKRRREEGV